MDDKLAQAVIDAWDAYDVYYRNVGPLYIALSDAINALRIPMPLIVIPLFVKLPSITNQRGNWRAHAPLKKRQRNAPILDCCSGLNKHGKPQGRIHVTLTRIIQGGHKLDENNLPAAFKSVIDGIADAFGIDDRSERWCWHYAQRKANKGERPGLTGIVEIGW